MGKSMTKPVSSSPVTVEFYSIDWDVDRKSDLKSLPKKYVVDVEANFDIENEGANLLSDKFGFCVNGFNFKIK